MVKQKVFGFSAAYLMFPLNKLDIASRRSVSPDGTWLKWECVGLEPVFWSTRSGFSIVRHKEGLTYPPPPLSLNRQPPLCCL